MTLCPLPGYRTSVQCPVARKDKITNEVDHFICLLGDGTLKSENVRNEIKWAYEAEGVWSIPIWQPSFNFNSEELAQYDSVIKHFVEKRNAIRITEESARAYDTAISLLLNQLGFAT
jgi:hypothetical protein